MRLRNRYGCRPFQDLDASEDFARFSDGRPWTHAEGPMALFEAEFGGRVVLRVRYGGECVVLRWHR